MISDEHQIRALSFGGVADLYERARPGYPDDAVAWMTGGTPIRVLDLGAGTGKLTRSLAEAGHDVVAVEPSQAMLAQLQATLPRVEAFPGSAESIPLPDASVDVVTVAQAFHWFDQAAALPEIARVIRPGGHLSLIWNLRDGSVPWVDELWSVMSPEENMQQAIAALSSGTLFDAPITAMFTHEQQLNRDSLVALVRSRSYVALLPEDELADVMAAADDIYDRHAEPDGLTLPYVTHAFRLAKVAEA
ncbi:MAG: class I SAM-dependent methyltransferase [Jiangellaceae bacterium]